MSFNDKYRCSELELDEFVLFDKIKLKSGVYNDIIKLLGHKDSETIRGIWEWCFKGNFIPIISTMFGDLFLLSLNNGEIYYFQPQGANFHHLCDDVYELFDVALCHNSIVEGLLREQLTKELLDRFGKIKFTDIFILVPWEILGGEIHVQNYKAGNNFIYQDLVSKTLQKHIYEK